MNFVCKRQSDDECVDHKVVATLDGMGHPSSAVAHLMPTRSILNEIESCCRGPLLHEKSTSTRKVEEKKGKMVLRRKGERERRWIEKKRKKKKLYSKKKMGGGNLGK